MSQIDSLRERIAPDGPLADDAPSPPPPDGPVAGGAPSPRPDDQPVASDLQERRDALARELAELQWDLGGLAYEMAIRDHFRLDLLVRQAGRLQEADAKLSEVEHLLLLDRTGAAGACPRCGTLHARGALFCSQCAFQLVQVQHAGALAVPAPDAAPTERLPATAETPAPAAPDAPYGVHVPDAPSGPAVPDAPHGVHIPGVPRGLDAPSAPRGVRPPAEGEDTTAFERPTEDAPAR